MKSFTRKFYTAYVQCETEENQIAKHTKGIKILLILIRKWANKCVNMPEYIEYFQ